MSNSAAIAAVTATIRKLLRDGLESVASDIDVTTQPPDRMQSTATGVNRVNVFLYQTSLDAAWRNADPPGLRPGEEGFPPLPLSLHYLVTCYPLDEKEPELLGHQLLGRAMSVLHDHPVLGADEIKGALGSPAAPMSDLDQQVERVRITPQPMTLEEMSKLWTTFQSQYRISAAYQACVVLIESERPARASVPVLQRNPGDTGPIAQAGTILPIPTIEEIVLPGSEPTAHLGDVIVLRGHNLGATTAVVMSHQRLAAPVSVPVAAGDARPGAVTFTLPATPDALPAGLWSVRAQAGPTVLPTNDAPLAVAPKLSNAVATRNAKDEVTVTVTVAPHVVEDQDVVLFLAETARLPRPNAPLTALTFSPLDVPAGEYLLRVRVDGVDNHYIDRTTTPPTFMADQKVIVP